MAEMKKGDVTGARNDLQQAKNIAQGGKVECIAILEQALGQPSATPGAR
jgi:hypothetical protein